MQNRIKIANKTFELELIRKKSIKHIYLKILSKDKLQIRTNNYIEYEHILDFIYTKEKWITKHTANISKKEILDDSFLFLGEYKKYIDYGIDSKTLDSFYKKHTDLILGIVDRYATITRLYPTQVKFRRNKSRWGSCSFKNVINLNIYLLKMPISFIEYVVLHELAHIKHKNHQKEFWKLVEFYMDDYKSRQKLSLSYDL
jgi:predicted metal-dependent hydrolase